MNQVPSDDLLSPGDTARRRDVALSGALHTPLQHKTVPTKEVNRRPGVAARWGGPCTSAPVVPL
jgi:hypothetical protein